MNSPLVRLVNTTSQVMLIALNSGDYIKGRLLDVGCGDMPFRRALSDKVDEWVGVDLRPVGDIVADPHDMHVIEDESFDTVLLVDVLQACILPNLVISECVRVLKPGGRLILSVPDTFVDDGASFYRFTGAGIQTLIDKAGLELEVLLTEGKVFSHEWAEEFGSLHDETKGWLDKMDHLYPQVVFAIAAKPEKES